MQNSGNIASFSQVDFAVLAKNGFLDVGWQKDGVDSQQPGNYRRIFHTTDYVAKNWKNYLDVVSATDGYSDHQTAVVLREPA